MPVVCPLTEKIPLRAIAGNTSDIKPFYSLHSTCFMYGLSIYEIKKTLLYDSSDWLKLACTGCDKS